MENDVWEPQSYLAGVTSCTHYKVTYRREMWGAGISCQKQDPMWGEGGTLS